MLWNKMTAVVDSKHPVAILTTQLDVSLKQFEARSSVNIYLCVWSFHLGCCDQEPCQDTKDLPMQSLCCSRVAASKLFNQVHDKQQIFFIHLQIFFINLQLCPAVVSGSETSLLSRVQKIEWENEKVVEAEKFRLWIWI